MTNGVIVPVGVKVAVTVNVLVGGEVLVGVNVLVTVGVGTGLLGVMTIGLQESIRNVPNEIKKNKKIYFILTWR